jgi:hypothetical protein
MPTKITLILDNPANPDTFEGEFAALSRCAASFPNLVRLESAKVWPKDDGTPTPAYRTLDLYFEDYASASQAVTTPEAGAFFQQLEAMHGTLQTGLFSDVEEN